MNKNIALMALTGILTLASCGQNGSSTDTTAPTNVSLTANPVQLPSTGGAVSLTGTAKDNVGVTSVTIVGGATNMTCTVSGSATATYNCGTDNIPANTGTAAKVYTYTATARDAAGNATPSNSVQVTVAGNPNGGNNGGGQTTTNHVLTVRLSGVANAPITIKDANGAVVAGYANAPMTNGGTVTLPAGKYTVYAGDVAGYTTTTPSTSADLSAGDAAITLNYTAKSTAGSKGEAYYIDADGVTRHYFNFGSTAYDPTKFRFSAWLQNRSGGVEPTQAGKGGAGVGNATPAEQYEWAPINHQNILGSYMEYNDNGVWRPVVNAQVVMNIQPETQNATPAIRFTAADDVNRSTPPITAQGIKAQDITTNGFTSTSWTNSGTEANPIGYPVNSQYPLWNVTGVGVGPDNTGTGNELEAGYTWAALMNDPIATKAGSSIFGGQNDSLDARVQVIGYVNGQEIGKQWVTKRFIPTATVTIEKQLWTIDPVTKAYVTRLKGDGTDEPLKPGMEAGLRIVVTNTGQAVAKDVQMAENKVDLAAANKTYSIGMTPAEYSRLTGSGVTFNSTVANGAQNYTFANQQFSATISSLAPGASEHFDFVGTALDNGLYCDTGTLGDYLNNPLTSADPVTGTVIRLTPLYGNKTSKACFTINGTPTISINKKITLLDKNGQVVPGGYDNNPMDGNNQTTNRNQWVDVAITVRNNGSQTANNVLVSDRLNGDANAAAHSIQILPPVVGMNQPTAQPNSDDGLDFSIPALGAGQDVTYHYSARANADGSYCDTASITSITMPDGTTVTTPTDSSWNSGACFKVAMADLAITKTNVPDQGVLPGQSYTSTITVKNNGSSDAYDVNVFDLLGLSDDGRTRVTFVNGRYTITRDENLPFTGPRGVANAGETVANGQRTPVLTDTAPNGTVPTNAAPAATTNAIVTNPPAVADQVKSSDGVVHGLVIPAGGSLALNVVSTIPLTAPVGNYCDVGVVTANTENLVTNINRVSACTTIRRVYAIQPQFDDTTDPIVQGGTTDFIATAYNEAGSSDNIYKNVFNFNIGSATPQSNAANSATGTFTTSGLEVYYDTAPATINGNVIFNPQDGTTIPLPASAYTATGFGNGKFSITIPDQQVVPGGAIFVKFTGLAPVTGATTDTSYNSYFDWTSTTGVISNVVKNGNSGEDTTVKAK